jgi:hypothetical protein
MQPVAAVLGLVGAAGLLACFVAGIALWAVEHAPPFVWGAVVRLPKSEADPEPEIRLIAPEEQAELFQAFLHVQALWNWQQAQQAARLAAQEGAR